MFKEYYQQKIEALKERRQILKDKLATAPEGNERYQAERELKAIAVELENYIGASMR